MSDFGTVSKPRMSDFGTVSKPRKAGPVEGPEKVTNTLDAARLDACREPPARGHVAPYWCPAVRDVMTSHAAVEGPVGTAC